MMRSRWSFCFPARRLNVRVSLVAALGEAQPIAAREAIRRASVNAADNRAHLLAASTCVCVRVRSLWSMFSCNLVRAWESHLESPAQAPKQLAAKPSSSHKFESKTPSDGALYFFLFF